MCMAQVQLRMIYGYKMSSQTRSQKTSLARPQGAVALTAYQAILAQRHPNTNHVIQVTMIALLMSSTLPISALGHIPLLHFINHDCAILLTTKHSFIVPEASSLRIRSTALLQITAQ